MVEEELLWRRGDAKLGGFTCQMFGLPLAPVWLHWCGHARALCELRRYDELAGCYGEEPCHVGRVLLPAVWRQLPERKGEGDGARRTESVAKEQTSTGSERASPPQLLRTPAPGLGLLAFGSAPMPGPTQALSPNGENNNDIIQDNGTIIPFRKHTVRGERSYR